MNKMQGGNFVQMRAEPSLLELCRVQPKLLKFYCMIKKTTAKISIKQIHF